MITERLTRLAPPGTKIPEHLGKHCYVKNWQEDARGRVLLDYVFVYRSTTTMPPAKSVTEQEIVAAYEYLQLNGEISQEWYEVEFPTISYRQPSNFAAIGGLFELLGEVKYIEKGLYRKI